MDRLEMLVGDRMERLSRSRILTKEEASEVMRYLSHLDMQLLISLLRSRGADTDRRRAGF